MVNFSNQTHPVTEPSPIPAIRDWMLRHYNECLADGGTVDAESLAEQAAWEFGCERWLAEDLAAEVKVAVDTIYPERI